ncbi:MAG TPA: DNA replication and repair protein RecF [Solirubrobacterales bacterium]|nr:DNA replication and repair protein RecF [Solirubrobacterales bacterium]
MRVAALSVVGFRNLAAAEIPLGDGINLAWGPNGAGKTNLLDALYTALAGRSCRTRNDREAIAFGEPLARAEAWVASAGGEHAFMTAISRADGRRQRVDGQPAEAEHATLRPALAVFLPDRLVLVKGPPAARRAHLDRFSAALWPARAESRRRYSRALAQRNALLGRIRSGGASAGSLDAWDSELAAAGAELIAARAEASALLAPEFTALAAALGLEGEATLEYAPRSEATTASELAAELGVRREADLVRGFTTHGPHLDELALRLDGRLLRRYGSQGQQRIGVLALLFAEREVLVGTGRPAPLMLLDDVTSELDTDRRRLLCDRVAGGQALLTATEPDQLPAVSRTEIALTSGRAITAASRAA